MPVTRRTIAGAAIVVLALVAVHDLLKRHKKYAAAASHAAARLRRLVTDDEPHSGNSTLQPSGPVEYRDTLRVEELSCFAPPKPYFGDPTPYNADLTQNGVDSMIYGGNNRALSPLNEYDPRQNKGIYDSMNTLYSTADVNPLITGQAYEFRNNTRDVYANRTAVGGQWGLQEFAPDSAAGAVGVDVGPNMLSEYEGSALGYNDGIPEQWAFPSTPFRRYVPKNADYYGDDGVEVGNGDRLYPLWDPDHDPLVGEETGPGAL